MAHDPMAASLKLAMVVRGSGKKQIGLLRLLQMFSNSFFGLTSSSNTAATTTPPAQN